MRSHELIIAQIRNLEPLFPLATKLAEAIEKTNIMAFPPEAEEGYWDLVYDDICNGWGACISDDSTPCSRIIIGTNIPFFTVYVDRESLWIGIEHYVHSAHIGFHLATGIVTHLWADNEQTTEPLWGSDDINERRRQLIKTLGSPDGEWVVTEYLEDRNIIYHRIYGPNVVEAEIQYEEWLATVPVRERSLYLREDKR